jgi:hypothetical protein
MTCNRCEFVNLSEMAEFCAGLTTRGIAFRAFSKGDCYVVEITGY